MNLYELVPFFTIVVLIIDVIEHTNVDCDWNCQFRSKLFGCYSLSSNHQLVEVPAGIYVYNCRGCESTTLLSFSTSSLNKSNAIIYYPSQSLSTIVDVIIVQRWNIKFGISDKLFFFLGNAVFESLVGILLGLPMSAIFAKVRR